MTSFLPEIRSQIRSRPSSVSDRLSSCCESLGSSLVCFALFISQIASGAYGDLAKETCRGPERIVAPLSAS
jgi:hypothetical protein